MTQDYPLHWPEGWPRERCLRWPGAKFGHGLTLAKARDRLIDELRLLGACNVVVSTNLELRNDGLPRSGQRRPDDCGVAVYFQRDGRAMCMAYDTWNTVEHNANALALAIAGMRQMERHGGAHMVERAFEGFAALPPPDAPLDWRAVLGLTSLDGLAEALAAYRQKSKERHPDVPGGSTEKMAELNAAIAQARKELT